MIIINLIKIGAIWFCDFINKCWDPFKQAHFAVSSSNSAELAEKLFVHLQTNHVVEGKFHYQLPMPPDSGDYALFQGLYLAMLAYKGADTTAAFAELEKLFINDILIRGVRKDGTLNDTTSNDSATGVLLGLAAVGDQVLIKRWAQRICDSDYALTDLNGIPTQYGQLEQGWKTDPLRLTLLLAILALAGPNFQDRYQALYKKYRLLLRYPKVKLLWWDKDYDTHRAAIHLHVLWGLTHDPIYVDGLRRIRRITQKSNNAWVETLCGPAGKPWDANLTMLYTFTYEDRVKGVIQSINSGTVESVKWGDDIRARETLPLCKRGSQDFFWQRNMFSLDEWVGVNEAYVFHSGLDYLICYWLAKRQGSI